MNQAASNLADRRSSKEMYEVKDFYRQKVTGAERQKAGWLLQGHFPIGDGRGLTGRIPNQC